MQLLAETKLKPLSLFYYGHPALKKKSLGIKELTPEIRELAAQMLVTVREHEGIGLAAPQVGHSLKLVLLEVPVPEEDEPHPTSPGEIALLPRMPIAMVNPELRDFSAQTGVSSEGCLSLPDIKGEVERPEFVQLTFQSLDGETVSYRCGGLLARCVQHEVDHLDGILFPERMAAANVRGIAPALAELRQESKNNLKL